MSYEDGWAALNLEMPNRVPRTEYSAGNHWSLVREVTGIDIDKDSPDDKKIKARSAFRQAWNYDLVWSTAIGGSIFGEVRSNMGHAVYAEGGVDYDDNISALFTDPENALNFDPFDYYEIPPQSELVEQFEKAYQENCKQNPDSVNMTGIYVTMISGLIEIYGWDMLLLAAGTDTVRFGKVANRYAQFIQHYYNALAEAEVPMVMVHDDIVWTAGPFINPDWYREYVFPNYKNYFAPLLESGKKILFTSDGNYTEFIDDIADCGVHGFVLEPTTDMKYIADNYGQTHAFIGNADTRILLQGTREEIRAEVERCMAIGKDCPGFFMAVGNHIPANTPVENAIYYNQVYEELCKR